MKTNERLKLVIVAGKGNRSGVPRYVCNLYQTLSHKYDLKVIADGNTGGFDFIPKKDLIIVPGLASERSGVEKIKAFYGLLYHLRVADIVWAHSSFSILFSRFIKIFRKYKLVITYHGLPFGSGRPPLVSKIAFIIEFFTLRMVKHKIVIISKLDEMGIKELCATADYTYIPNSVDMPIKIQKSPEYENTRLIMTTRDSYQKNLDYAVELLNKLPTFSLDVYGAISKERRHLLSTNNHACNITFHGEVPRDTINFSNYSVYLMTSRYEGFSLGLLEAWSMGLGILTTNVGGAMEVSENNNCFALLNGNLRDDVDAANSLIAKLKQNKMAPGEISTRRKMFSYSEWQRSCLEILE